MSVQCPNCRCYKTRRTGGRGMLLDIGKALGIPAVLLGLLGLLAGGLLILIDRLLIPLALGGIVGGLQVVALGITPLVLPRLGSHRSWYCYICGYHWRDDA